MAERTRPIRIEFCVTEQERRLIQNKMAQLGTRNMGAYPVSYTHLDVYKRQMSRLADRPERSFRRCVRTAAVLAVL